MNKMIHLNERIKIMFHFDIEWYGQRIFISVEIE